MTEDPPSLIADIVAQDARGRDILVVKARGTVLAPEMIGRYFEYLERASPSTPFYMLADLEAIYLKKNGAGLTPLRLDAAAILSHYEPEFGHKPILHGYLSALVDTWLRDLIYHWKSETPPGSEELAQFGLLERLAGGTTEREVLVGEDSLR